MVSSLDELRMIKLVNTVQTYNIQPNDGIKVFELTRDKPVNDGSKRNSGIVVEIECLLILRAIIK
nr:hypothetical protein [Mycoplasmopsis bovis]